MKIGEANQGKEIIDYPMIKISTSASMIMDTTWSLMIQNSTSQSIIQNPTSEPTGANSSLRLVKHVTTEKI